MIVAKFNVYLQQNSENHKLSNKIYKFAVELKHFTLWVISIDLK